MLCNGGVKNALVQRKNNRGSLNRELDVGKLTATVPVTGGRRLISSSVGADHALENWLIGKPPSLASLNKMNKITFVKAGDKYRIFPC